MLVKTEGFSLGRGTRVKDGEIQKLQWALLKLSKQTEPVSAASDISWTYSLDLVDSLKPAGSLPVRFLRMCSSAWDAKESDGSRRNCESVTAEMKVLALCRRRKSFARCRPLWMCFKDLQTWSAVFKKQDLVLNLFPLLVCFHSPGLQASIGPRPPTDPGQSASKWACNFIGQSRLQRRFFAKKAKQKQTKHK